MNDLRDPADTLIMDRAEEFENLDPDDPALQRIEHYHLRREIGRGAMSVVYEAQDTRTGQTVALKLLTLAPSLTPEKAGDLIARFEREARTTACLSHPNIVRVHEINPRQSRPFLVMEYLNGQTLRQRMSAGTLTPEEAFPILTQIAGALDAVHTAGIVHRDVKPTNVMLLPDGTSKLLDFGIARSCENTTVTHMGIIVGSPSYMAPEQIKEEPKTTATDIWALGVLSYEMLAGYLPFTGQTVGSVMYQIMHQPPAPMPDLPPAVQQALLRALNKQPAERYSTASAFVEALKSAYLGQKSAPLGQKSVPLGQAPAAHVPKPAAPSPRTAPRWLPGAALLALFLLGFCGAFTMRLNARRHAPMVAADQKPAQRLVPSPAPASHFQEARSGISPVPYHALPVTIPFQAEIASRSRHSASVNALNLHRLRKPPTLQVKQAAAHAGPVLVAHAPVSALPRRLSAAMRPAAVKQVAVMPVAVRQAAKQHVPAPAVSHQAAVQVVSRPVLIQQTDRSEAAQSADQSAAAPTPSAEQSVSLPTDEGGYDPEADARLRKSAWSQNGAVSHP